MSDLITTTQDAYRSACIATFVSLMSAGTSLVERARDPRGQTAAEYMGVLLLISLIIVAILKADVDGKIQRALSGAVDKINNACTTAGKETC